MKLLEAINSRRSIRSFLDVPVERNILKHAFNAAMEAPSPKNSQPWNFAVFDGASRDTLADKISAIVENEVHLGSVNTCVLETVRALNEAPVFVLVFNTATSRYKNEPDPITARIIDVQSIGASIQNFILAAHEKGLGTLWICDLLDVRPVVELLESDQELVAVLAIGYPKVTPPRPPRRSMDKIVTWQTVVRE